MFEKKIFKLEFSHIFARLIIKWKIPSAMQLPFQEEENLREFY